MDRQQHIVKDRPDQCEQYEARSQNECLRNPGIIPYEAIKQAEHDRSKTDRPDHSVACPVYANALRGNQKNVDCAQRTNDSQNKSLITREYHQRPQLIS